MDGVRRWFQRRPFSSNGSNSSSSGNGRALGGTAVGGGDGKPSALSEAGQDRAGAGEEEGQQVEVSGEFDHCTLKLIRVPKRSCRMVGGFDPHKKVSRRLHAAPMVAEPSISSHFRPCPGL